MSVCHGLARVTDDEACCAHGNFSAFHNLSERVAETVKHLPVLA